jgi:hypothetical protein
MVPAQRWRRFESGEVAQDSVVCCLETVTASGRSWRTRYYTLDAIIAVGYGVNCSNAMQLTRRSCKSRAKTNAHE